MCAASEWRYMEMMIDPWLYGIWGYQAVAIKISVFWVFWDVTPYTSHVKSHKDSTASQNATQRTSHTRSHRQSNSSKMTVIFNNFYNRFSKHLWTCHTRMTTGHTGQGNSKHSHKEMFMIREASRQYTLTSDCTEMPSAYSTCNVSHT